MRISIILPSFIKCLSRNKIIRNVLIVSSGTAGAQIISLLASPIITRLYTPEAIGMLGSFMAIVAILLPIAALSYPIAIVLPKSHDDAIKVANNSLRIAIFFTIALTVMILLFQEKLINLIGMEGSSTLFIALSLPLAILINTLLAICTQWAIRHKLFVINAQAVVAQSLTLNGTKILFGLLALPLGKVLIVLTILGSLLQSIVLLLLMKLKKKEELKLPLNASFDSTLIKQYREFPFYRSPQGLLANLNQNIPVILLASLFGAASVGFYALCRTVLQLPVTLIAKSVNDVIYPQINQTSINNKPISSLIIRGTLWLSILGLAPLLLFIAIGPDLFSLVFGDTWQKAGEISQWLSVWFYFNFINRACVAAIPVLRLERFLLLNSLLNFILSSLGFYIGYNIFDNDVYAVAMYSLFGIIPQIIIISFVIFSAKKHDKQLLDYKESTGSSV
ncbi:oligosaccharide flippase family protein [Colwellia sp. UCD-KL20]|uniref:lipopolysaccharide biosynthesis protein n=1 Tax=Colwellia sp. UCD-KL20 TaxID=1917165 RepID=UPI0009F98C8A|nr:oligosaccharide flippase family protein [Colwellia sp. UCD-KL20]